MRQASRTLATFLLLLAGGHLRAEPPGEFFFQPGDRIVFLGDSITEQYQYSSTIELYLTTRFPKWDLTFLNAGIGGDTATGGAARFADHVLAEKPTALTIDFGMNDGGYGKFNSAARDRYRDKTEAMVEAAKKAGVRVALISPNAVDWRVNEKLKTYLETQKEFYAPLRELAAKHGVPFVDQYAVTRAVLEKLEQDKAVALKPFPDGVHTSSAGGLLMAHTILTGLYAPAPVSQVEIDAVTGQSKTEACTVDKLLCTPDRVHFDRTDEALPLPVQKDWVPLLPYVNQLKDLNHYGLRVSGLTGANYALQIDGKDVGSFSAAQLAEGVNLGNLTAGPIHDRGQKVFFAINAKNGLVHQRFRGVVMYQAPDWLADVVAERKPRELQKRLEQVSGRQAEIYKLVQPVAHHFELKAAK